MGTGPAPMSTGSPIRTDRPPEPPPRRWVGVALGAMVAAVLILLWGGWEPVPVRPRSEPIEPFPTTTVFETGLAADWSALVLPGDGELRDVAVDRSGRWVAIGGPREAQYAGFSGADVSFLWTSPDGTSWSPVADPDGVFDDSTVVAVTAHPEGFAAVGWWRTGVGSQTLPVVWLSPDGTRWEPVFSTPLRFGGPGGLHAVHAHGDQLIALGWEGSVQLGFGVPPRMAGALQEPRIWVSSGGRSWRSAEVELPEPSVAPWIADLTSVGERLVAVGAVAGRGAVWSSEDGRRWVPVPNAPRPGGAGFSSIVPRDDGGAVALAAATGVSPGASGLPQVWWMDPGGEWHRLAEAPLAEGFDRLVEIGGEVAAVPERPDVASHPVAWFATRGGEAWQEVRWSTGSGLGLGASIAQPRAVARGGAAAHGIAVAVGSDGLQPALWVQGSSMSPMASVGGSSAAWSEVARIAASSGPFDLSLKAVGEGLVALIDGRPWWSEDGTSWSAGGGDFARVSNARIVSLTSAPSGILGAGWGPDGHALVWKSSDGRSWEQAADFGEGAVGAIALIDQRPMAWGYLVDAELGWFVAADDGAGWVIVRTDPEGPAGSPQAPLTDRPRRLAGLRYGTGEPTVVLSENGLDWREVAVPAGVTGVHSVMETPSGVLLIASPESGGFALFRLEAGDRWSALPVGPSDQWPVVSAGEDWVTVATPGPGGERLWVSADLDTWEEVPLDVAHGFTGVGAQVGAGTEPIMAVGYDRGFVRLWRLAGR